MMRKGSATRHTGASVSLDSGVARIQKDRLGPVPQDGYDALASKLRGLEKAVMAPTRSRVSISLCDLGSPKVGLKTPIIILLEYYEEEVIASWPEVEAWASGASDAEALNALKDEIATLYDDLTSTPVSKLGQLPRRWLSTLRATVRVNEEPLE